MEWMTFTFTQPQVCYTVSRLAYPAVQKFITLLCLAPGMHTCKHAAWEIQDMLKKGWTSIKDVHVSHFYLFVKTERHQSNAFLLTWGQRLRLACQKPTDIISPTEIGEKPLPHISHCALTLKGGPERIIACADKTTLLLTCSWMWLSYYQEGSLKRRWEEPGFERWVRSCGDHLQPVAATPPLYPLSAAPFPAPW